MSRRSHAGRLAAALLLAATACGTAHAAKNILLLYNGPAIANTQPMPTNAAFVNWCLGTCTPSVHLPMVDPASGKPRGDILVWTHPFQFGAGGSLCFSEYIVYRLPEGEIHTASHDLGVCGAPIDAALKPATRATLPGVVIAGGGDGVIVDGTMTYRGARGTYTDRVFVEFSLVFGGTNYYDQLFFILSLDR